MSTFWLWYAILAVISHVVFTVILSRMREFTGDRFAAIAVLLLCTVLWPFAFIVLLGVCFVAYLTNSDNHSKFPLKIVFVTGHNIGTFYCYLEKRINTFWGNGCADTKNKERTL